MAKLQLVKKAVAPKVAPELLVKVHDLMVKTRALEERLIKMYKQSDGFFWIGGPGEEAFNVPLGLQIKKGRGPAFDFFHGHYRSSGVILAMGAEPLDFMRQMKNTAKDPFSGGRNFCCHTSIRAWNVCPITSPIETQYSIAPGTAMANKRAGKGAITVVTGGDAGTAEADFPTCLVWSSRPGQELPLLIVVTNNKWGISTPASTQHGERLISDRGKAFGMRTATINGNDVEESWLRLQEAIAYVREEGKPFLLEAQVSRLYGHSSASGANLVGNEDDPIKLLEARLEATGVRSPRETKGVWDRWVEEMAALSKRVRDEPQPEPESLWDNIWYGQKGRTGRYW